MSLLPKRNIFQVLGCLMQKPELMNEDKYKFSKEDFQENGESKFYVLIFAAINNMLSQDIEDIDIMMIDSYLSSYDIQYKLFNDNEGVEYLQRAVSESKLKNFDYNYSQMKKFSLLRAYKAYGFNISEIYDENIIDPKEQEKMVEQFEGMDIQEIINYFERIQLEIRSEYLIDANVSTEKAGVGSKELFNKFKKKPDYGISLIGNIQNTIFRGAKTKTLGMRSAPSNLGKTRIALAEATDMAIDEIYNIEKKVWEKRNSAERVLFISTEMEKDRLEPTMWAYISGVAEEKIKDALCTPEEEERIFKAIEILQRSTLWVDYIPDFDTNLIETKIKQHILEDKTQYIFFDYVHISYAIMKELAEQSKGMNMREDMVLFMFVSRLEQISKKYNVWIQTASQVNGEWKHVTNADSTILRGAKNMADKLHRGVVALTPTKADLEAIEPILRNGFFKQPNVVYHIYKNRETKFKDMKLWLHIDMDTMRIYELFLTTNDYELVNIEPTVIHNENDVKNTYEV
jgi:replicative DNA helicase